ncbi:MAG: hypothetical protein ACOYJB_07420 [Christensenellaceae bacterium]
MKKRLVLLALVLAFAFTAFIGCSKKDEQATQQPAQVETVQPSESADTDGQEAEPSANTQDGAQPPAKIGDAVSKTPDGAEAPAPEEEVPAPAE